MGPSGSPGEKGTRGKRGKRVRKQPETLQNNRFLSFASASILMHDNHLLSSVLLYLEFDVEQQCMIFFKPAGFCFKYNGLK